MADILYTYKKQVYANITNRCDCSCEFCIRTHKDSVGEADNLWLEKDPTLDEIKVAMDNFDFTTNFTAVAATINNIGPGLEAVGPTCNFSIFSPLSTLVFIMNMLIGRLEIFPIMLMFYAGTWRKP